MKPEITLSQQEPGFARLSQLSMPTPAIIDQISQEIAGCANKELLIYIHVPFCSTKCTFCDWVADVPVRSLIGGPSVRRTYVEALCKRIRFLGRN